MSAGARPSPAKRLTRARRRAYQILEQAVPGDRVATFAHVSLVAFVVASVASVVLESVPSLRDRYEGVFTGVEIASMAVFTVEYALRLWAAVEYPNLRHLPPWRARLRHALTASSIIDLLAIVPFYLAYVIAADFRVFVVFRLLRFLKLMRYSPGMRSLMEAVYAERRALAACLVILGSLVISTAAVMHLVEADAQPDKFGTIPDAMWWAVITLATVGYGDVVPITALGKVIASLTALMGLVMLALPVGIVATAFAEVIHRREFVVTWGMIARVPLFSELSAEEVVAVMRLLRSKTAQAGEVIVRRGEVGHSMYFIATGQVEIETQHGKRHLLGEGQFFGEIAVLRNARRTATIRAVIRSQLLVLDAGDLRRLMESRPDIGARISQIASDRAARSAQTVTDDFTGEHPFGDL
ncbi:cyclic nucleotide-binding protein [Alsobacter metallidurans]|uniref:Cyclic nucleotide-binding protein n=1 Tax=Alsobacter metallidurans TaxID=340221 RepID=A0A917MIS3_9HYPH|nr:cyclic nucleotide-gated ion channel [Alsobacter metallidurans]GGH26365.1 cyclic nucleotide-binding protein [Alsobacter metallidurans]